MRFEANLLFSDKVRHSMDDIQVIDLTVPLNSKPKNNTAYDIEIVSYQKPTPAIQIVSSKSADKPVKVFRNAVQFHGRNGLIQEAINKHFDLSSEPPKTGSPEVPAHAAMLKCAICLSFASPTTNLSSTKCGHIFCSPCLEACLLIARKCPTCRKAIPKGSFHRLYL